MSRSSMRSHMLHLHKLLETTGDFLPKELRRQIHDEKEAVREKLRLDWEPTRAEAMVFARFTTKVLKVAYARARVKRRSDIVSEMRLAGIPEGEAL